MDGSIFPLDLVSTVNPNVNSNTTTVGVNPGSKTRFINNYVALTNHAAQLVEDMEIFLLVSDILWWIVVIFGYIANIFLLALIVRYRKTILNVATNVLVLSLVIGDVIALTVFVGVEIYSYVHHLSFQETMEFYVKMRSTLLTTSGIFANLIVSSLSILKFVAVFFPFKARDWMKNKTGVWMSIFCLILSIGATIPLHIAPIGLRMLKMKNDERDIGLITDELYMNCAMFLVLVAMSITALVVLVTYPPIIYRLCRPKVGRKEKYAKAAKHIGMILVVFIFYLILFASADMVWYGLAIYNVVNNTPVPTAINSLIKYVIFISHPLSMLHMVLNPILHALSTENYMNLYMPVFCKQNIASTPSTS